MERKITITEAKNLDTNIAPGTLVILTYTSNGLSGLQGDYDVIEVGFFVDKSSNYIQLADRELLQAGAVTYKTFRRIKVDKIKDIKTLARPKLRE